MKETLREYMRKSAALPSQGDLPVPSEYVPTGSAATRGNPFIEVFARSILDVPNFADRCIDQLPEPPPTGSVVHPNPVLMALDLAHLYRAAYPTPMLERLNQRLLEIIAIGYLQRNPLDERATARVVYVLTTTSPDALRSQLERSVVVSPPSLLIIGASGMGKSFGVEFVLSLLTQAWQHEEYQGSPFKQVQIVWLYVQCPATGTLRALLLSILLQIDLLLGTEHYLRWLHSKEPVDVLIVSVAVILYVNGVGCLVLDELQHLKTRGFKETETMLNFFVSLMNFLRVPLVSIGTYAAIEVLTGVMRDARRLSAAGTLDFRRYEWSAPTTRPLQDFYFGWLPGLRHAPLTDEVHSDLYDVHQGFHFLLPNLVHRCSVEVSLRGLTHVTPEVLTYYKEVELKPIARALEALRTADVSTISKYDDVLSPDAILALRAYQRRRHGEHGSSESEMPASAHRSVALDGPFHAEFPHLGFTDEELAHQCAETKLLFREDDIYGSLKLKGVIATQIASGTLVPRGDKGG